MLNFTMKTNYSGEEPLNIDGLEFDKKIASEKANLSQQPFIQVQADLAILTPRGWVSPFYFISTTGIPDNKFPGLKAYLDQEILICKRNIKDSIIQTLQSGYLPVPTGPDIIFKGDKEDMKILAISEPSIIKSDSMFMKQLGEMIKEA